MSKTNKLAKGLSIYSIGNLGSRLVTFLLVPFYTYYIKPGAFGYFDISVTIIFFSIPFITLQLRDGVFRFLLSANSEEEKAQIISSVYKVIFSTGIIVAALLFIGSLFYKIDYFYYILVSLVVYAVYEIQIQVVRGLGKNIVFVTTGILTSLGICLISLFCLIVLKMGINGIYVANIFARLISLIFIEVKLNIFSNYLKKGKVWNALSKRLIKYSLPLIPNVICWWFINSADRIFIEKFVGINANGMYAVSIKFATILVTFAGIFYQAWQEIAIVEYNSPGRDKFFSKVFNNYYRFLVISAVLFAIIIKIIYPHIISKAYSESLQYVYILLLSAVFSALSSFLDLAYQCSLKSYRTLQSIVLTAILSVVLTFFLVRIYGMLGVISAALISYLFLFIYRMFDTREFFIIKVDIETWLSNLSIIIGGFLFYYINSIVGLVFGFITVLVFGLYIQKELLTELYEKILGKNKTKLN